MSLVHLASLPQVLRRADALIILDLALNPLLELQDDDVDTVFVHLHCLRDLSIVRGSVEPGAGKEWSAATLCAVTKLCRECPLVTVEA